MLDKKLQKLIESSDSIGILEFLVSKEYVADLLLVKKELSNRNPGFALDIDETLSATNTLWFESMLKLFGNPENLSPIEMTEKYRFTNNVPYFQNNPEIEKWMHDKREDNDFQEKIPLIERSNEVYQEIHENHIEISLYITARPESVKAGTAHWLKKHNFPQTEIILRPTKLDHAYSNLWKASVLDILYPEIQGIVDDNPGLIRYLSKHYKGLIFAYSHNENFGRDNVINCLSHEDVKIHMGIYFNK